MNRAVTALYEPGSTFKLITLAAAFDQGITNPDEVFDCENGTTYVAGHKIHDHKRFGLLTVSDILALSSDVGAIKIAERLGVGEQAARADAEDKTAVQHVIEHRDILGHPQRRTRRQHDAELPHPDVLCVQRNERVQEHRVVRNFEPFDVEVVFRERNRVVTKVVRVNRQQPRLRRVGRSEIPVRCMTAPWLAETP